MIKHKRLSSSGQTLPVGTNVGNVRAPAGRLGAVEARQATFHFKTLLEADREEIDDSRKLGQPFELLLGKKFKLEIWEELIKTMKIGEVAEFTCNIRHTAVYPVVSKSFREMIEKQNHSHSHHHKEEHRHHCAYEALKEGLGYPELDAITKQPQPLIFVMELLSVELPGSYQKDIWAMSADEKLNKLPVWKEEGNCALKEGRYKDAAEKYAFAIGCIEHLALREKPNTPEWHEINARKIPFLLNLSQCCLMQEDYYQVIKHTTAVLELDKDNVKALFRRGKAHSACWNPEDSKKDFERVTELDPSLKTIVQKELRKLHEEIKIKSKEDKDKWGNIFS